MLDSFQRCGARTRLVRPHFHFRAEFGEFRVSSESHAVVWCAPAEFDRYVLPGSVRRAYVRVRELSSSK